jgi:hypothetical protein
MFNPLAVDSVPPNIPMPEVFSNQYSWTYSSGCPFISPSLNAKAEGLAAAVKADPDVIVLPSPDKVQYFDNPKIMEYIPIPPAKATTADDPTGMKAMMEFLGFKKDIVDAGGASIDSHAKANSQQIGPNGPSIVGPNGATAGPNVQSQPAGAGFGSNLPSRPMGPTGAPAGLNLQSQPAGAGFGSNLAPTGAGFGPSQQIRRS